MPQMGPLAWVSLWVGVIGMVFVFSLMAYFFYWSEGVGSGRQGQEGGVSWEWY